MHAHEHQHQHEDHAHRRVRPQRAAGGAGRGVDEVLRLQRLVGNSAASDLVRSVVDEAEAERAEVQRSSVREALSGPGKPVPDDMRSEAEARLGVDLSGVRLHTGAAAERSTEEMGAHAYTTGRDVVLGRGGKNWKTLLHEFDHVRQQAEGRVEGTDQGNGMRVSDPSDRHEREAEANATRALRGEPPGPHHHGGAAGGHHGGVPVQFARIRDVQPGLSKDDVKRIEQRLRATELQVPVPLPAGRTELRTRRQDNARGIDPRLHVTSSTVGLARIDWNELIAGAPIPMGYGPYEIRVLPHSADALAVATDELVELMDSQHFSGEALMENFTRPLMEWLVRQRSNSGGDVTVVANRVTTDEGTGTEITVGGRPGWDTQANQIVTGYGEDRRHIIAWHAMRGAFENAFNAALAPGENIKERMRALIRILNAPATWADLDAAESGSESGSQDIGGAGSQGGSDVSMADVPAAATTSPPSPAGSGMELDTPPRVASPNSDHGSSQAGSTTSEQLRGDLVAAVTRVLDMLSNNPFNLWAGDAQANQSINRVRQQVAAEMKAKSDDQELVDAVRARAREKAETPNQDQPVWTEVRDTLEGTPADEARTILQSMVDTFDVDIPVAGGGNASTTYPASDDQIAAVRNTLATGLAQELLAMSDNDLPGDFDKLIDTIGRWLRRFLRPEHLRTTVEGGRRTVRRRPQS
ncbi:DUF4157 domain-containing protein [Saccharothrix sp. S26]|uniref:eCIS core domain-containing protein n=1 Tax=Saccharothrix sp. S26 TaxID=2907215 RepID=UPI001F282675|nr:DUF4157 domain-containing protein [Saccharothrix sp. S26]MCE6995313.1 DUF4157 domain-containing protein [Saccharothrix sp. S26]